MRDWYGRLRDYFPEKEMKSKQHFELLFQEKKEIYQLEESPDHILVSLEKSDYVFIDYILVDASSRGKGTGSIVLDQLKRKGKAIILEVEPITISDPDSEKRIRFYEKNGFSMMNSIRYERIHMITKELSKMHILAWTPDSRTEEWVFEQMKDIYNEAHAYKSMELYGCHPQSASEVLWMGEPESVRLALQYHA